MNNTKKKLKTGFYSGLLFNAFKQDEEDKTVYTIAPKYGRLSYVLWNMGHKVLCLYDDNITFNIKLIIDGDYPMNETVVGSIKCMSKN